MEADKVVYSMEKVLKQDSANMWTMARFYLAIVQVALLYGMDSWTINIQNMDALDCFHKCAARHITGELI